MKENGRVSYKLEDAGEVVQYTYTGDFTMNTHGVTMFTGECAQNNSDISFTAESICLIPWHSVCWIELRGA